MSADAGRSLRVDHRPTRSPEEVAAIVAAVAARRGAARGRGARAPTTTLHEWVHAARLRARRAGLQRGPWRLSAASAGAPAPDAMTGRAVRATPSS